MNNETFEEKISLKLTPLNLSALIGSVVIFLIVAVISLIAFTPLREYIPGYADVNVNRQVRLLLTKADSLEQEVRVKTTYINNINNIIAGKDTPENVEQKNDTNIRYENINTSPSTEDSILRKQIELEDKYSLALGTTKPRKGDIADFFFFSPLKGLVTNSFNQQEEHFGVDITAQENEAVKAVLDGTVINAAWTSEAGYVIHIQHDSNLISIYKHNSVLLKNVGQYVKSGEVIAIIGNSGELTSGTHLHLELWYNGNPINPQDYIVF